MNLSNVKTTLQSLNSIMLRRESSYLKLKGNKKYHPLPLSKCPTLDPEWSLKPGVKEFNEPILAITTLLGQFNTKNK